MKRFYIIIHFHNVLGLAKLKLLLLSYTVIAWKESTIPEQTYILQGKVIHEVVHTEAVMGGSGLVWGSDVWQWSCVRQWWVAAILCEAVIGGSGLVWGSDGWQWYPVRERQWCVAVVPSEADCCWCVEELVHLFVVLEVLSSRMYAVLVPFWTCSGFNFSFMNLGLMP